MLREGDERFHYSDGSHRWVRPDPDMSDEAWTALVMAHLTAHVDSPGGYMLPDAAPGGQPRRDRGSHNGRGRRGGRR